MVVFAYVPFLLCHPQFLRKRILEGGCFPGNGYLLSRQLGCCVYLLALWIDSCLAALNVPACHVVENEKFSFLQNVSWSCVWLPHWRKISRRRGRELESSSSRLFFLKGSFAKVVILLPALPTQGSGSSRVGSLIPWPWRGTQTALVTAPRWCPPCSRLPPERPVPGLSLWVPETWYLCVWWQKRCVSDLWSPRGQSCVAFCSGFFSLATFLAQWLYFSLWTTCYLLFCFLDILLTGRQRKNCFPVL